MAERSGGRHEKPADAEAATGVGHTGQPLDRATRRAMERRFAHDFTDVRVHTDTTAARVAWQLGARAYTVGSEIAFGAHEYAPHTVRGQGLLAHELTHVVQARPGVARQSLDGEASSEPAELDADRAATSVVEGHLPMVTSARPAGTGPPEPGLGPEWVPVKQLGIVRVAEEPQPVSIGARLRATPAADAPVVRELAQNAKVLVLAKSGEPGRRVYAQTMDGGERGFIADWLVWYPLPDPEAVLHYVTEPGLGLQKLVENHPQYQNYDITTGDDARSLVMAVLMANDLDPRTAGRVYINEAKLAAARDPGLFDQLLDAGDEYRAVLRPMLQSVEMQRFEKIWLPGPAYVRSLRESGIIPTRPEWKNTAIAVVKGIGGFLAGLVGGFVSAVVDVFVEVYELVKSVISTTIDLISGKLLEQAQELYDELDNYSVGQLLTELAGALTQAAAGFFNNFVDRWTADNLYEKWYFRGSVVGYVLAEVLMFIFTGGVATAVKWLAKLGKIGMRLSKALEAVLGAVDKALDAIPGRRAKKPDGDVDRGDASDKAKQLPMALASARMITEANDRADSPVSLLGAALLPLKLKYHWISAFRAVSLGPGTFRIEMVASTHEVDDHYTTSAGDETDSGDQDITGTHPPAVKPSATTPTSAPDWDDLVARAEVPQARQSTGGFRSQSFRQGDHEAILLEGPVGDQLAETERWASSKLPRTLKDEHGTHGAGLQAGENLPEAITSAPGADLNLSHLKRVENAIREVADNAKPHGGGVDTKTVLMVEHRIVGGQAVRVLVGIRRKAWLRLPGSDSFKQFVDFEARIDAVSRQVTVLRPAP